jgi:hypothetical protein
MNDARWGRIWTDFVAREGGLMGLFDKRKRDDFESPVEQIDLSGAAGAAAPGPHPMAEPTLRDLPAAAGAKPASTPVERPASAYGINDAIDLMRALPQDNVELVVQVVKRTLESTQVKVATIIDDASRKQADIEGRVEVLGREIAELEEEIATRRSEIGALEADHKETTMVKERLVLAEKLVSGAAAKAAAGPGPAAGATSGAVASPATGEPTGPRTRSPSASSPPPTSGSLPSAMGRTTETKGTIIAKK